MKHLQKILIVLAIIGTMASSYFQEMTIKKLESENNLLAVDIDSLKQENIIAKTKLEESRLYNKFANVVDSVGNIPWSPDDNCYDHSKALQAELKKNNIASSIFITPTRDHAFIGVWIEATTGNFIKPNRYDVGELRDYNLDVICE
jgi:hypothetical protein